jgi:hypothetical protein
MPFRVRTHVDLATVEQIVDTQQEAEEQAIQNVSIGVWKGTRLYPPHSVLFVDIEEVKA